MAYAPNYDPFLSISRGLVAGHGVYHKFGRNADLDSGVEEDIWEGGGIYDGWLSSAETVNIVSTSTNDDGSPAGTGARTVEVIGLDSSGLWQQETITMNGTTNVATSNTYLGVFRMYVITAGSLGSNDGLITATSATTAKELARITSPLNQTLMALATVPSNTKFYMYYYYAGVQDLQTATGLTVFLKIRNNGEVFQVKHTVGCDARYGNIPFRFQFTPPLEVSASADIKISAVVSANNIDLTAGWGGVLVDQ